ncbi:MAG TPA: class I SAM-dependent methyltransferase [Patescibacteria group bacterium]|nr:class I SAM-dependent methyltransferase [Patescibacteria group bacterium]
MKTRLVKQGYEKAADHYLQHRDQFKNVAYLDRFASLLRPGARILDIGCGAGKPVDVYLVEKGFTVTGIDLSNKQIQLAKKHVPNATFEVKDMSQLKHGEYHVDAIVSFYAIFHIPRESHAALFKTFCSFLPKGGLLLATMGSSEWEGVEKNFHGVKMYWSHYGSEENRIIIQLAGFDIVFDTIDTSGGERHQVVIAKKK